MAGPSMHGKGSSLGNEGATAGPSPPPSSISCSGYFRVAGSTAALALSLYTLTSVVPAIFDATIPQQLVRLSLPANSSLHSLSSSIPPLQPPLSQSMPPSPRKEVATVPWRVDHIKELSCDLPYQRVDHNCPRFLNWENAQAAGLGNRIAAYIFSLVAALDLRATFLFSEDGFSGYSGGHGVYTWANDFLQLSYREHTFEQAIQSYQLEQVALTEGGWEKMLSENKDKCNVVFNMTYKVCQSSAFGCLMAEEPRFYQRAKHILRCKMMHSPGGNFSLVMSKDRYNVAWHIRVGDLSLHREDQGYYERAKDQLEQVLQDFDVDIHFFAEASDCVEKPPDGYEFLSTLFPEAQYHNTLTPGETIYNFMNADLLFTSGSSFTTAAAMMSVKPVVFFETPKEGAFFGSHVDSEYVLVNDGIIFGNSLSEARAQVMYKYDLFHDKVVPDPIPVPDTTDFEHEVNVVNMGLE